MESHNEGGDGKVVIGGSGNGEKIEGLVQPLSKNQLKKMKRKEEWEMNKKKMRKEKKDRQKERRKKEKEMHPELKTNTTVNVNSITSIDVSKPSRKERTEEYKKKVSEGIKIIIDCDYEELMNDKSINSMCRQIADCYSINRHSTNPFNIILYNVGNRLRDQLQKNNYDKWLGVTSINKGDYASFASFAKSTSVFALKEDSEEYQAKTYYLTADSPNELNELEKDKAYIIGGIVDRNRYKMISYNKAIELGINHGKLPIGEYMKLNSSKVLTTNHAFAILSHFNDHKDWKEAFMTIIPKRKIDGQDNDDNGDGDGDVSDNEEQEEDKKQPKEEPISK